MVLFCKQKGNLDCVLEQIDIIEEYSHPLTASDTFLAGRLKEKKKILRQKLKQQEAKISQIVP